MNTISNRIVLSSYFIVLEVFNQILMHAPFFALRCWLLRLAGFDIGRKVSFHRGVRVLSLRQALNIGDNTVINTGCILDNRRGLTIGSNTSISQGCVIYTLGHDHNSPLFETKGRPVVIGNNVVIYSRTAVMPGIVISDNAVVLPHSVVTKDVPENMIVGGSPAVVKGERKSKVEYLLDYRVWFGI